MDCNFDQSTNLSDYSKFYEKENDNMIELFFDIFRGMKMDVSTDPSDSSPTNYSEFDSSFDLSSDLPSSESLTNLAETDLSSDLPSLESSTNLAETDLSSDLPSLESLPTPEIDSTFDLSTDLPLANYEMNEQINKNNNSIKPINLPASLTKTYDSIAEKALALEKLHNRIRNTISELRNQNDELIKSFTALNRIVIQLDLHSPKLCLLSKLSNLKSDINEYKEYLIKDHFTSSTNSIEQMIELFYSSYHEFDTTLKNCKSIDELMSHSTMLQSNLEHLRTVYPEYKNLKKELPSEFRKHKSMIKLLRYNISRVLVDIVIELSSDESYQLFNSFTQHNLLFSFRLLLKSIS